MLGTMTTARVLWLFQAISFCYTTSVAPKWDSFVFTQQWPQSVCNEGMQEKNATCKIPTGVNYWTIHGLWPQEQHSEPHCPKIPPFDPAEIKELIPKLNQYWPDIFSRQNQYWPDIFSTKYWFWQHEWETHGTCASSLPATKNETLYFGKGLELRQKYDDISRTLNDCGIRPSISKAYKKQDILNCYQKKFHVRVNARCFKNEKANRYEIVETRICLSKTFRLMNCMKESTMEGKGRHTGKGTANCPDKGIYYPPIKK